VLATLKKVAKDCTTEVGGQRYCMFRIGGCMLTLMGVPTFIGLTVYSTLHPEHAFDKMAFGSAFCAMLSGIGLLAGGVTFKARGETPPDSANTQN
jgi:hypothetical protein